MITVAETEPFQRKEAKLPSREEREDLVAYLAERPDSGALSAAIASWSKLYQLVIVFSVLIWVSITITIRVDGGMRCAFPPYDPFVSFREFRGPCFSWPITTASIEGTGGLRKLRKLFG